MFEDLLKKTNAELAKELRDKRETLRMWRFALSGSKVKNLKEGKTMRKDIARIKTAINAKKEA